MNKINTMTLELALTMIEGVKKARVENNLPPFNIAVVDDAALLTAFNRQDGSLKGSLQVSLMKAKSSALFQLTTRQIKEATFGNDDGTPPADPGMVSIPGVLPVPGGIPVFTNDGICIGAIGVSGANDDDDERCALAAIEHAKTKFALK